MTTTGARTGWHRIDEVPDEGRVRTAVICAPTPRGADGGLDLTQVESAARTLAAHLRSLMSRPCPVSSCSSLARAWRAPARYRPPPTAATGFPPV